MATLSYRNTVVRRGGAGATDQQIRDLQRDLRRLGYLRRGVDGDFGRMTEDAVKALQFDLLHGMDREKGAPVNVKDYNKSRVADVDGVCDRDLADCISDILDDPEFPELPRADDPRAENDRIAGEIAELESDEVPVPFIMAILRQESDLHHFHQPTGKDEDTFITVGLDINAGERHIITSRGYGAGQFTLFHHPPTVAEVDDVMRDVGKNLSKAFAELREKFDHFVNGKTNSTVADDRKAEHGAGPEFPLRLCKFEPDDERFMRDCVRCALEAGTRRITVGERTDGGTTAGASRHHRNTKHRYTKNQYYRVGSYEGVPRREKLGCDWPYATRRYNGSGNSSYHYQARVLRFLSKLPKRPE